MLKFTGSIITYECRYFVSKGEGLLDLLIIPSICYCACRLQLQFVDAVLVNISISTKDSSFVVALAILFGLHVKGRYYADTTVKLDAWNNNFVYGSNIVVVTLWNYCAVEKFLGNQSMFYQTNFPM